MPAPTSYCVWVLCGAGFLRAPDARLVAALGLGGEDPGWVPAPPQYDIAFATRVSELITDATSVVLDVPREISAQLAPPVDGGDGDPRNELARQRLAGWRGAGHLEHHRQESRLADLTPSSGSTDPDQLLLAAARALATPGTHVVILQPSPWIDAKLTNGTESSDRRIHTPGHLAPLDDPAVIARQHQRGQRQRHERAQLARWATLLLAPCLVGILALFVLPVALAWDDWRVPFWTAAGCAGLMWLWFTARIARQLRSPAV